MTIFSNVDTIPWSATAAASAAQLNLNTATPPGRIAYVQGFIVTSQQTSSVTAQVSLGSLFGPGNGSTNTLIMQYPKTAGSANTFQQTFISPVTATNGVGCNIQLTVSAETSATSTNASMWGFYV